MFKLVNYKWDDIFENVEDAVECAVNYVLTEKFHNNAIDMTNDICKGQSLFVACEGGYTDTIIKDGIYTLEEIMEFLWDFASFVYDWNNYAEKCGYPVVVEVE